MRSEAQFLSPWGCEIAPPARTTPGGAIGVLGVTARLFDNRWMHVCRNKRGPSVMAGGRMAFSHEITRLPGGDLIRSPCHCRLLEFDSCTEVARLAQKAERLFRKQRVGG